MSTQHVTSKSHLPSVTVQLPACKFSTHLHTALIMQKVTGVGGKDKHVSLINY